MQYYLPQCYLYWNDKYITSFISPSKTHIIWIIITLVLTCIVDQISPHFLIHDKFLCQYWWTLSTQKLLVRWITSLQCPFRPSRAHWNFSHVYVGKKLRLQNYFCVMLEYKSNVTKRQTRWFQRWRQKIKYKWYESHELRSCRNWR